MPEDYEKYWKVVRPHRHPNTPLNEVFAKGQGQEENPRVHLAPSVYNDIERQVQETIREMVRSGVRIDQGYAERLRSNLEWDYEESTRSAPDPENPQGVTSELIQAIQQLQDAEGQADPQPQRPNRVWGPQEEALRMTAQVDENYLWYQSQGLNVSRATLEWIYRRDGGLRMDFSQARAEEERLQREAAINQAISIPHMRGRLATGTAGARENRINYESMGRQSEVLLQIVNLFNELGVSCTVVNHSWPTNPTVEFQFRLFADSEGVPIGISGGFRPDGVVHLSLNY